MSTPTECRCSFHARAGFPDYPGPLGNFGSYVLASMMIDGTLNFKP
jgi:hypothetical protein